MKKILILLSVLTISVSVLKAREKKPNFIFILVDDLGKEWVSCYGAKDIKTPNIDKLASEGIKFNKVYSMPQCTPSRVALLSGQYPYKNGWINHYDVPRWGHGARFDPVLNPSYAKELRDKGYKTCAAGKWQISDFRVEPEAMVNAGFDEYCMWTGYESNNEPSEKRYWNPYLHTKDGSRTYEGQFGPDVFCDFVIDFMEKNKQDPMCIYYPMVLTHGPFVHTPHEPNVKSKYDKHCAMVRYTDYIVGKIEKAIDRLGIEDNTYLIFTTDNGTSGTVIGRRDDVYIRGGKAHLSENGINSPFIVKTPNAVKNHDTDALVDFTDIYPTLLDLAGVKSKNKSQLDGQSFAKVINGKATQGKRDWTLSMGGYRAMIGNDGRVKNCFVFRDRILRNDRYKAYVDTLKNIHRIYDLEADPYEQKNLIDEPGLLSVLKQFQTILDDIPNQDNHPKYTKSSESPENVPVKSFNKAAMSSKNRNNMKKLATEKEYEKFKNAN
ncbi:MAG: sulfatase-like hydrolase/transferase [Carboxylicivirga sp.]|jgi:arylsulfatase A-like enzyme|nr:sulfatase-like hydrolase/transferase [Carboxylicivirga sp.]